MPVYSFSLQYNINPVAHFQTPVQSLILLAIKKLPCWTISHDSTIIIIIMFKQTWSIKPRAYKRGRGHASNIHGKIQNITKNSNVHTRRIGVYVIVTWHGTGKELSACGGLQLSRCHALMQKEMASFVQKGVQSAKLLLWRKKRKKTKVTRQLSRAEVATVADVDDSKLLCDLC